MKQTLQGTLPDYCAAQDVAQDLMEMGVTLDDIRLIPNHSTLPSFETTGDAWAEATLKATKIGAIAGAVIGLSFGVLLDRGGGVVSAGAWLLSILIGACLGGVAGSIFGAVWEYIVEETEAERVAAQRNRSVTLLVRVGPKLASNVRQVLMKDGAEHVYASARSWSLMTR